MTDLSRPPTRLANNLGALALIPFAAGAVGIWTVGPAAHPFVAQALSGYAAVVMSFIGGIHWGFAFRTPSSRSFVWGVVPSIVAWGALLAAPPAGLSIHAAMLLVCYAVDRATYPAAGATAWLPLRLRLTIGAVVWCVVGALGA